MPIRINLLAEAQAAEEARRKDPVKRGIWIAGFLVFLMLLWSGTLVLKSMAANSDRQRYENDWKSLESKYTNVTGNRKKIAAIDGKLSALNRLSSERLLWGTTLNAFQQTTVDQVQLLRIHTEQSYNITPPVPSKKDGTNITKAKPGLSDEKIMITVDAKDYGPVNGQNYNKYQTDLAAFPYFKNVLKKADAVRLSNLSNEPEVDLNEPGRSFRRFTLEIRFPEVRRSE